VVPHDLPETQPSKHLRHICSVTVCNLFALVDCVGVEDFDWSVSATF